MILEKEVEMLSLLHKVHPGGKGTTVYETYEMALQALRHVQSLVKYPVGTLVTPKLPGVRRYKGLPCERFLVPGVRLLIVDVKALKKPKGLTWFYLCRVENNECESFALVYYEKELILLSSYNRRHPPTDPRQMEIPC